MLEYHKPLPAHSAKRKARLSYIMGLIGQDSIVLACESQTTRGNFKFNKANKIEVVRAGDMDVLVAESGYEVLSQRAIELFRQRVANLNPANDTAVAEGLAASVRDAAKEHISGAGEKTLSEAKDYFSINTPFEVMVAYFFQNKPCLFKVSAWGCVPEKCKGIFLSSGTGRELGDCLLDEHAQSGMDTTMCILLGIATVDKVSQYISSCGGRVNIGVIRQTVKDGFGSLAGPIILNDETVDDFSEKVRKAEMESKAERVNNYDKALYTIRMESAARLMAEFSNAKELQ